MKSKLLAKIIILIIISSAILIKGVSSDATSEPAKLKIYIGPTSVPADNSMYNCIFVQLQDSTGKPARAVQDTTISLSSSQTNVGTVDSSITIPKDATYASTNFYSTYTPGTTTIAATATGYTTVQATIKTEGPIPSSIAAYGFPSTLPADGGSYSAIMVQLQDSSGSPARAPKDGVQVTLSCSNLVVGSVPTTVTILGGQTYAIANFTTTTTKGQAIITPIAPDYTSKQVTITTQNIATAPSQFKIFLGPTQVLADKSAYRQIAIELQNSAGNIAAAPSDLTVTVASSDESIGKTEPEIIIPQSNTYGLATLTTTYKAGATTITAAATDYVVSQATINTIGFVPSKLAVYCVPATLPSDNATYQSIQVQLQDSQGRPAKDPEADVTVNLFSSKPTVGDASPTLTIPFGQTQATGAFTVTNSPGSTSITAQASNYITGQASITTYLIDLSALQITLTANPESILNGNTTVITAFITVDGTPITGATVNFTSNTGGTFTTTKEQGEGYYNTTFTAPSFSKTTICTITASASKTGFKSSQATSQVTVGQTATGTIQFCIKDANENPLNETTVSSTAQPTGMKALSDITNATGYVTFKNATAGLYTFNISKNGYEEMNKTINFKGQTVTINLFLSSESPSAKGNTLPTILPFVIVPVIIAVVIGIFLIRRRNKE